MYENSFATTLTINGVNEELEVFFFFEVYKFECDLDWFERTNY
jgi:hypothetical protein